MVEKHTVEIEEESVGNEPAITADLGEESVGHVPEESEVVDTPDIDLATEVPQETEPEEPVATEPEEVGEEAQPEDIEFPVFK